MAAGDWSAANKQNLQGLADGIFSPDGPRAYETVRKLPILKRFLERQTARPQLIMTADECIGVKVFWQKSGRTTVTYDGDGTTPELSLACDLPTGWQAEADSQTYTDNLRIIDHFQILETDCDNEIIFADRFAFHFKLTRANILQKLNAQVVNFMDTNKQDNTDADLTGIDMGNGAWQVNADNATIEIPEGDALTWETLSYVDDVMNNNSVYDYDLYAGRWFFHNEYMNSQFLAENSDGKAAMAAYDASRIVTWDNRYFDSVLTGKNLIGVDPSSYLFWNRSDSSNIPNNFDYDKVRYSLADPEYMVMGANGLEPLMWEFVEQRNCSGRDANTNHVMLRKFEMKILGILDTAPPNYGGETGIVKIQAIPAA